MNLYLFVCVLNPVCQKLQDGVAVIFGPMFTESTYSVQSLCEAVQMPHVEARWTAEEKSVPLSINMYPYHATLSHAFIDFVYLQDWTSFIYIYKG